MLPGGGIGYFKYLGRCYFRTMDTFSLNFVFFFCRLFFFIIRYPFEPIVGEALLLTLFTTEVYVMFFFGQRMLCTVQQVG